MSEQDPEVTGAFSALATGFNLNRKQVALAMRISWVVVVSTTLYYLLFGFALLGIPAPHASAADLAQVKSDISALKQTSAISARAGLAAEIRAQVQAYCAVRESISARETIRRTIDQRQDEYAALNGGYRYPEPGCSQ